MNQSGKVALVVGANRGIGLGIIKNLLLDQSYTKIYATYRVSERSKSLLNLSQENKQRLSCIVFDANQESHYSSLCDNIKNDINKLDLCINAVGILDNGITFPERKIEDVTLDSLSNAFANNTVPTLLLAKALKSLLLNSLLPVFVSISAKVGSISDNGLGGWYSYRVSKAALNMAIKNLSIEFKRFHKQSVFTAIHPGTTETDLSKPFIKNASKQYTIHQPEQAGQNILKVAHSLKPSQTGCFFSWDGSPLSW